MYYSNTIFSQPIGMSFAPGSESLFAPSEFGRNDHVPFDVEQSTGVPTDFGGSDPFGIGAMSTSYDGAKDGNTGVNAVNRPLTHTYLVNSGALPRDPYYHEALCWIRSPARANVNISNVAQQSTQIMSISCFNRFLKSPEGRSQFGFESNATRLRQAWRFLGSVKRPKQPIILDDAIPIIFGGRARIADLARAFTPKTPTERLMRGIPSKLDTMFIVYRRYNKKYDLMDDLSDTSLMTQMQAMDAVQEVEDTQRRRVANGYVPEHYWQAEVFINRTGKVPDVEYYTDELCSNPADNFIGDYERVGWIHFVYGNREFSSDSVDKARRVIHGSDNYAESLVTLEAVEVFIGQY